MCLACQFLQCFVGLEQSKHRTRARSEKARKSRRFGLENRARERSGNLKLSPGGFVRAPKREKVARSSAIFFKVGASEPVRARKGRSRAAEERPGSEAPEGPVRADR